uniref:Uncharacterized protein n=1 Tax=Heterorhabditis bacteriophora TaxID=37862 RepID=A0A1I7WR33_HETBA
MALSLIILIFFMSIRKLTFSRIILKEESHSLGKRTEDGKI